MTVHKQYWQVDVSLFPSQVPTLCLDSMVSPLFVRSWVHVCSAVTCHIHLWRNGRGLLCATAVTHSWTKLMLKWESAQSHPWQTKLSCHSSWGWNKQAFHHRPDALQLSDTRYCVDHPHKKKKEEKQELKPKSIWSWVHALPLSLSHATSSSVWVCVHDFVSLCVCVCVCACARTYMHVHVCACMCEKPATIQPTNQPTQPHAK